MNQLITHVQQHIVLPPLYREHPASCVDTDLIAASLLGDEDAFRQIVVRYTPLITRVIGRIFSHRHQVEEIVQITFLDAWRSLDTYENRSERSFPAWLSRIALNTCYDELRRIRKRRENPMSQIKEVDDYEEGLQNVAGGAIDVEREVISRDLAVKLLRRLDPEDRRVLILLKIEGWSVAEIASVTGWSPAKVKMRVFRARKTFQRAMRRIR